MIINNLSRFHAQFHPDFTLVNDDYLVLDDFNLFGFRSSGKRNWLMTLEGIFLGNSIVTYGNSTAGGVTYRATDNLSLMHIILITKGEILLKNPIVEKGEFSANESFFFTSKAEADLEFMSQTQFISISVPLRELEENGAVPGTALGRLDVSELLKDPIMSFLYKTARSDAKSSEMLSSYFMEKIVQEMAISILLTHASQVSSVLRVNLPLYERAKTIIIAEHADPHLTSQSIANDLNVSTRQLQREFRSHGTTVTRAIRKFRAELAVQLLKNESYELLSIEQLARYAGFSSARQLRLAFLDLNLGTPTSIRASDR